MRELLDALAWTGEASLSQKNPNRSVWKVFRVDYGEWLQLDISSETVAIATTYVV